MPNNITVYSCASYLTTGKPLSLIASLSAFLIAPARAYTTVQNIAAGCRLQCPVLSKDCYTHLRAVENTELIHVIPDVQVLGGALVLGEHELLGPPVPGGWVQVVQVGRRPRPTPPAAISLVMRGTILHPDLVFRNGYSSNDL